MAFKYTIFLFGTKLFVFDFQVANFGAANATVAHALQEGHVLCGVGATGRNGQLKVLGADLGREYVALASFRGGYGRMLRTELKWKLVA